MARTRVPINPDVLAWAMEQAGIGDAGLAERCRTSEQAVREWRTGAATPGKTQFRRLVAKLRRPSAVYFLPEPPASDPAIAAFRHPPGSRIARDLIDREQTAIRTAERIQQVSRWFREKAEAVPEPWPRLADRKPAEAARSAREFLAWDVQIQFRARSPSQVSAALRTCIEERGAHVLQLKLSQDGCRGFSLAHEAAPVIAVNSAYTVPARIFSMMHEVGHLVQHQPAFCARLPDSKIERWCERFAAVFLMPQSTFHDYVTDRFRGQPVADLEQVTSVARKFKVSLRAAALRIEHLDLGVPGLYDMVDAKADFKGSSGFSKDNTKPAIRLREWGPSYAKTLIEAESQGLLSRTDALEYLNVSNRQFLDVRERLESMTTGLED